MSGTITHADAVVVGAGPSGAAAAAFLAQAGHDVVLIEKEAFPRDKVCGDGLTPRAVRALSQLGLHDEAQGDLPGWDRQSGLRMHGAGVVLELPWPKLDAFPDYSLTATRALFDHTLARHAVKCGAQLWEETEVVDPVWLSPAKTRIAGVTYRKSSDGPDAPVGTVRAPIVVVADGNSSRLAVRMGLHRRTDRPMGVAIRGYYRSPRAASGMMDGFLDLRCGDELLPGYGWIFPLSDGLCNVGWGLIDSSVHFRSTNYRKTLIDWVDGFPKEWEMSPETAIGRPRSASLPMGHNRTPHVHRGALMVGDSGGMVNPFNGEGISYGIEAAAMAAEAATAALAAHSDAPLQGYPRAVAAAWGGYYTLGRMFLSVMGKPVVMRYATELGMSRPTLMRFVFRTMAHLTNQNSRDVTDLVVNTLSRVVPAA